MARSSQVVGMLLPGEPMAWRPAEADLAQELARQGVAVHVWWMMRPPRGLLHAPIRQHTLVADPLDSVGRGGWMRDIAFRAGTLLGPLRHRWPDGFRRPHDMATLTPFLRRCGQLHDGRDATVLRLARQMTRAGVTHVLAGQWLLGLWVAEAARHMPSPPRCAVLFQDMEMLSVFQRERTLRDTLTDGMNRLLESGCDAALTPSRRYRDRLVREFGVSESRLRVLPPGVAAAPEMARADARKQLRSRGLLKLNPDQPLVCQLARQDAEEGGDLLLLAVRMLKQQGVELEPVLAGPELNGQYCVEGLDILAQRMGLTIHRSEAREAAEQDAWLAASDVVVSATIAETAFDLMPMRALIQGTPVLMPAGSGLCELIEEPWLREAVTFDRLSSADLARKLKALLGDEALRRRIGDAGRAMQPRCAVQRYARDIQSLW
ncbi:MAG: glycosyltransferase family 4 protein [Phycisphaeraceae bacterium]|nr:glycosyltransferase family 4 protein [Phycisphaeraceae bacterium]